MIDAVEKRMEFDAAPERVWRAITDGAELASWFPDVSAFDLAPGAEGAFTWKSHGSFAARVEAFEPPAYLAWRWVQRAGDDVDGSGTTLVEFRLSARAGGGTVLELRESGFVREEDRKDNDGGWDSELSQLAVFLDG
ncbi:MAG: SRPBCC domain-containing protein [Acidobacteriota bacterium]|nr:SRPBCC domain-containing protein [Acidobacteriota bacterium]